MNIICNHIPENWKYKDHFAFMQWFEGVKEECKSKFNTNE